MTMSPVTRKALNFSSSLIQAAFDFFIHQLILAAVLALFAESLEFEVRVFLSGIIIACYAFSSLYGTPVLKHGFSYEKHSLAKTAILISFLSVLFAFTSNSYIPLFPVLLSLYLFMAANLGLRYSLRCFLASNPAAFLNILSAKPAYGSEGPDEETDTSLRKDYRHNMKDILRKKSRLYLFIKRAFDILSSGIALVILSPLLLVTAIAIKLEDGGPVFYSAKRWGKDLKLFKMHKFRSMKVNADALLKDLLKDSEMTGHAFKIKDDPRITKVGKFIRKYSIDELPQLWNIFTGDMSVVGPRPIMTVDTESIDDYDKQRWLVRPGLTCYWQVSGRADVKWAQWIEMDLDYIEKMSISEDIKLILKTFPVVFKASGAY
ncbi:MAG: sugar transferase [Synergistaceae bacterium]|nr:sugar transferase [Synergistaceae bacterium]